MIPHVWDHLGWLYCLTSILVLPLQACFVITHSHTCDGGGLVDVWWLKVVSVKWACVLLSAVASFGVLCVGVIRGAIGVFGWIQDEFVGVVDDLLSVIHAAVTDRDCIAIKIFLSLRSFGKCLSTRSRNLVWYWCWRFYWIGGCTRVCCFVVCFFVC